MFRCAGCDGLVRHPAEALERHDGPPLTIDDLIDLGRALDAGLAA